MGYLTNPSCRKLGRRGFVLLAFARTIIQNHANPVSANVGVKYMKKLLPIAFLTILHASACEEDCTQSQPPINCEEAMHAYSERIEYYADAVEKTRLPELVKFRAWLKENESIQLTCGAYNQSKTYEAPYKEIFLANIRLTTSINGLVQSSETLGKPDESIAGKVKKSYAIMRNSTKVFNNRSS